MGNAGQMTSEEVKKVVENILEEVRPNLQSHEGDAQLVDIDEENNVTLKIEGSCRGCPMSSLTFGLGVEKMIRDRAPDVGAVFYT
jgi:Fe-S cluster biogenesis protein NfuA